MTTFARVRRTAASVLTATTAVVLAGTSTVGHAAPAASETTAPGVYIVTLEDPPRPGSPAYTQRITADQDRVLGSLDDPEVLYRMTSALNGFVARLTADQVNRLRSTEGVALVERSSAQRTASVDSPRFLGLEEAWDATGGPGNAGAGVVVGIVDTGIWPENPSFAGLPGRARPDSLADACETGEDWDRSTCGSKVVAARYFVKAFGEANLSSSEYLSPRDSNGHGSHTAAVAAGNDAVDVRIEGQHFGEASGMAPAAQLAIYKACWTAPDPADDGCQTADTVAAVDRAVADGVDVLSYAVSGPRGADSDAVERAFLNASAAGVFVAAAAGNEGPAAATAAHASPWVTTVGASTHHAFEGALVLGDGEVHVGAMVSDTAVPSSPIVLAEQARAAGVSSSSAQLCERGSLSPAAVDGRIVVCDRGTVARVEKSAAVAEAGGVGMVLANVLPDSVSADFHSVPAVHLDAAAGGAVKRYLRDTEEPTASLDPSASAGSPTPQVAPFSSRGDAAADVLKPDLTAPGVGVLAAVAPPANFDRLWDLSSGTSAATAHVAGLAAFIRGERPSWSPSAIRSAMTTTAGDLTGLTGPLSEGAGNLTATDVLDPGLVFEAGTPSYRAFLEGRIDGNRLNLPSISVPELTGTTRVVRRVTNVSGGTETYSPRVTGLPGIETTVRPRTFTLGAGETRRVVVDLEAAGAPLDTPAKGHIVWTGLSHQARIPVVVRPRAVVAPDEVTGSVEAGSLPVTAVAGRDGAIGLTVSGLAAARPVGLTLEPGEFDPASPQADLDTAAIKVQVPAGTDTARFELDGHPGDDMDLFLYRDGDLLAAATGDDADEVLTRVRPDGGEYTLYVQSASAANRSTTTAQLYTWFLPPDDAHNVLAPAEVAVTKGRELDVELRWGDLDPTSRWFGSLGFEGTDERTFVVLE